MRKALRETGSSETYLGVKIRLIHETNLDGTEAYHVRTNRGNIISSARRALDAYALAREAIDRQAAEIMAARYN